MAGEDVKNVENSKYKTRQGAWELFTKIRQKLNIEIIADATISIFGIILVAATSHSHGNSALYFKSLPLHTFHIKAASVPPCAPLVQLQVQQNLVYTSSLINLTGLNIVE